MPDKQLPEHMQRVVQEQTQLADRAQKLTLFLHSDTYFKLPELERQLLKQQLAAMYAYNAALEARIQLALDNNN